MTTLNCGHTVHKWGRTYSPNGLYVQHSTSCNLGCGEEGIQMSSTVWSEPLSPDHC
jgi:hypothetical protein